MNKVQAQDTLNKLNVTIENKIVEHRDELGNYNKSIVMGEIEYLWKIKNALLKIIAKQLKFTLDNSDCICIIRVSKLISFLERTKC